MMMSQRKNTSNGWYGIFIYGIAVIGVTLLLSGCASTKKFFSYLGPTARGPETPESMAMAGLDEFNHAKYHKALEIFEDLKSRFPFSEVSLLAELKAADSNYYMNNYQEALLLYQEFEERHPTNEAIPYVLFQGGMCYYQQIDTIDRDISGAVNAINAFSRLLQTFPVSPYTDEAQARIMAARNFLANHEFYVASYYLRTESYQEAQARLDYITSQYPDTEIAPKAEMILSDLKAGKPPEKSWRSWVPDLSLPDWRIFSPFKSKGEPAEKAE